MLSQDVKNLSAAVLDMADRVSPDVWSELRHVKLNLDAIAQGVEQLENVPIWPGVLADESEVNYG